MCAPITVDYGITKDVNGLLSKSVINYLFTHTHRNLEFLMEGLFKAYSNKVTKMTISLKPTDKSTFRVLDTSHPFLILTFSNDLNLTALFKYSKFGNK